MKIGVEASALVRRQRTGVDYYTFNLIQALAQKRPRDRFVLPYLCFFTKRAPDMGFRSPNVIPKRIPFLPGKLYNGLFRYLIAPPIDLLGGARADIYIFPNFVRWPLLFTKKSVVIIYDLSYIHSSATAVERHRQFLTRFVPKAIAKSRGVITISENSKREIMAQYGLTTSQIVVAPPAIDASKFYKRSDQEVAKAISPFGLQAGKYVLFVGTIEPRKNLAGLLAAYADLPKQLRQDYPLVLVGAKGWLDTGINQTIEKMRSDGIKVIMPGYLPADDLPRFYSGAAVFVFPSLYEGFGMPPLEAMACGAPVVSANNSSLPEAVGDAGILVGAKDGKALSSAIRQVLSDKKLAQELQRKGYLQAQKFSWDKSAETVSELINRLVSSPQ